MNLLRNTVNMKNFVAFLLEKVYQPHPIKEEYIQTAFRQTVIDVNYHDATISKDEVQKRITTNNNELAVFLFRLGQELHKNGEEQLKPQIHWLLKELCCCEIYFNNEIGDGFCVVHGEGTVIGSRNKIGKGFKIHQGCTIGHKKNGEGKGNVIGNNVTLYSNSSITGELIIGDDVIIGTHVLVTENISSNAVITFRNSNK